MYCVIFNFPSTSNIRYCQICFSDHLYYVVTSIVRNWCPFPFTVHFNIIYHIFSNHLSYDTLCQCFFGIRVITKLPNTMQSAKGKGKTHMSTNRQNQWTTGKMGQPQWPWLGTGISKEMVGWIRFYGAKPLASTKGFRLSQKQHF